MNQKDFWKKSTVAVIGGGAWGTVLAQMASQNANEVRVWVREEERARAINASRTNPDYLPDMEISSNVKAYSDVSRVFEDGKVQAVIWALPSSVCREQANALSTVFSGEEIVLHATKGIEPESLKRVSEVLREELPIRRIGVISGPNLAKEVADGQPAATVVASEFEGVVRAGQELLNTDRFRVYSSRDMIGVEWAGVLKNVLAIAAGTLDALNFGWNTRALMITRGLAEMVRFSVAMGAEPSTFLGLAGIGDLLATCSSPLSRNYRVGMGLAKGEKLEDILENLGSTAEGVKTTKTVWDFARSQKIEMPITEGVYRLLYENVNVKDVLHDLMTRPLTSDDWK